MPEEIGNQIGEMFNAMGSSILISIGLYFVLPFLAIIIVSRFVFKLRGRVLRFIWLVAALGCFYFFTMKGLPQMQSIYTSLLK